MKLNLLLVAVEARKYEGGEIWINPKDKILSANNTGLFITSSSDAVKRAWFFCRVCHPNVATLEEIKKCACKKLAKTRYEYYINGSETHKNGYKRYFETEEQKQIHYFFSSVSFLSAYQRKFIKSSIIASLCCLYHLKLQS